MPTNEEQLLKRLLVTFKTEAREHVQTIASGLVELEKAPTGKAQFAILDLPTTALVHIGLVALGLALRIGGSKHPH